MHAHPVDEVEEHFLQRRPALVERRQGDSGRRGGGADGRGVRAGHRESGAQHLEGESRTGQRRRQRRAIGRVDDDGVLLVRRQLAQGPLEHQAAARDDQERLRRLLDLGEKVRGDEHGAPLACEVAEETPHPLDALGVETVRRLIEDQHTGVAEERIGQAEALAHAERESADLAAGDVGEADRAERLVDAGCRDARGVRVDLQMPRGAAAGVEARRLEGGPDGLQRSGQLRVALAADRRRSAGRSDEPQQDAQRRRLAGAVGSEEAGDDAGLDPGGERVDRRHGPEALGHAGELEDLSFGHSRASRRRGGIHPILADAEPSPPDHHTRGIIPCPRARVTLRA